MARLATMSNHVHLMVVPDSEDVSQTDGRNRCGVPGIPEWTGAFGAYGLFQPLHPDTPVPRPRPNRHPFLVHGFMQSWGKPVLTRRPEVATLEGLINGAPVAQQDRASVS